MSKKWKRIPAKIPQEDIKTVSGILVNAGLEIRITKVKTRSRVYDRYIEFREQEEQSEAEA